MLLKVVERNFSEVKWTSFLNNFLNGALVENFFPSEDLT